LGGILTLVIALVLIVSNQTEKLRAERKERESLEGASISSKWDFSCCELLEQLEVRFLNPCPCFKLFEITSNWTFKQIQKPFNFKARARIPRG